MTEGMISTPGAPVGNDAAYSILLEQIAATVAGNKESIFTTDAKPEVLWAAYLGGLPFELRQHYNCRCCQKFIERYGGLVYIDKEGHSLPLIWFKASADGTIFEASVHAMYSLVSRAKITGVFVNDDDTWGVAENVSKKGQTWTHFHGNPAFKYTEKAYTAPQRMAERVQDYEMLNRALAEYRPEVVSQALRILRADALDRSEKTLGAAEWLHDLHDRIESAPRYVRQNIVWKAVATAPAGFCHVRTNMIHTLMDDIKEGTLTFEAIAARWSAKMHPLQYQRPTAAPTEQAIDQAEKLVEKLGLARSFERRYATLEDVLARVWTSRATPAEAKKEGVFAAVREGVAPKKEPIELPLVTMTWRKFAEEVLPKALTMQCLVPQGHADFYGLVTAVHADAPPIIQWDVETNRNPASMFSIVGGSPAHFWGLTAGSWVNVPAIFLPPHTWLGGNFSNHGSKHAFFVMEGCKVTHFSSATFGAALFPEMLKSELHGVRSVVEAHSRKGTIADVEKGNANGLAFCGRPVVVKVRSADGLANFKIDRWD